MTEWKNWKPEFDGHAPDDWEASMEWDCPAYNNGAFVKDSFSSAPQWWEGETYRYRPMQDATHKPNNAAYGKKIADLTEQCLALPQADRDALIEALQKPDWADDVWDAVAETCCDDDAAAVIRSMCRPKEEEVSHARLRAVGDKYGLLPNTISTIVKEALSDE